MGKIIQINTKAKIENEVGLPKHFIKTAVVSESGLNGDYNNYRQDHPEQY